LLACRDGGGGVNAEIGGWRSKPSTSLKMEMRISEAK
jgi:hypothetical protein